MYYLAYIVYIHKQLLKFGVEKVIPTYLHNEK